MARTAQGAARHQSLQTGGGLITRVTRAVGTSTLSTLHPHHRHSGDTVAVQLSPPPATGRNCGECSHGGARPLLAPAGSWPPLDAGPGDDSAAVTGLLLVVTGHQAVTMPCSAPAWPPQASKSMTREYWAGAGRVLAKFLRTRQHFTHTGASELPSHGDPGIFS